MTDPARAARAKPDRIQTIRFGRRFDWAITLAIMVIAIGFIAMLQSLPQRATFFPWFITISIMLIGGIYCFGKLRHPDRWDGLYDPEETTDQAERDTGPVFMFEHGRGILRAVAIFLGLVARHLGAGPRDRGAAVPGRDAVDRRRKEIRRHPVGHRLLAGRPFRVRRRHVDQPALRFPDRGIFLMRLK